MAAGSFAQTNFQGGEWSAWAQGRFDRPDYRTALNVCLNWLPTEQGALVRRPGTQVGGTSRNGAPARVIAWDFRQATPYLIEFSAGKLRFWTFTSGAGQVVAGQTGPVLATTNDDALLGSVSVANPAVITLTVFRPTWATGDSIRFAGLASNYPLLQNRVFLITSLGNNFQFSLRDANTGANIDGGTLGVFIQAGATVQHIHEVATPYPASTWQQVRLVQSELQAVLLHPTIPPQVVTVTAATSTATFATFALAPAVFTDGPYLDPLTNGALLSPNATSGAVTFVLTFQAWLASVAYALGSFVNQGGVTYQSRVDQNLNLSPVSNPASWKAVSAGLAVGPNGFVGTDVGRLVRVLDTTGFWTWGKITAIANQIPPAAFTKFGSMSANGGIAAAFNGVTSQAAASCAAQSFANSIASSFVGVDYGASPQKVDHGTYYPSSDLGMSSASYTYNQQADLYQAKYDPGSLASLNYTGRINGAGGGFTVGDTLIGNSSGATGVLQNAPTTQASGTLSLSNVSGNFLSNEICHCNTTGAQTQVVSFTPPALLIWVFQSTSNTSTTAATSTSGNTVTLRGRLPGAGPSSPSDGTAISAATPSSGPSPVLITSTDPSTAYRYVWLDIEVTGVNLTLPANSDGRNTTALTFNAFAFNLTYSLTSFQINTFCAQAQFFNPTSSTVTANGNGVVVELFGAALSSSTQIISAWRLGTYSNTTGFPACGTYHENRLWLGGAVSNRVDASQTGNIFNYAPTLTNGQVPDNMAISATFSGPDVNTLFWLVPDEIGIIVGTQAGDWVIRATQSNLPLTPSSIQAHRFSKIGCANVEPRRADHTIIFVQRWGRKVMEMFADVFSQKLGAANITWNARHLTKAGVAEIAYQQELVPIIWSRQNDGSVFGCTYKRESNVSANPPNFAGFHRLTLGSGRTIESIAVGSSVDGLTDTLAMVTNDPTTNLRHIEFLTNIFEEGTPQSMAWFVDDGDNPTSVVLSSTTCVLNGLTLLNNKTVTVTCGGLDCGDWTVSAGSITMTYGDGVGAGTGGGLFTQAFARANSTTFVAGFTYTSDFQIVRPMTQQETGTRQGVGALGKRRRNMQLGVLLENTVAIFFGTSFTKLFPALFKQTPTSGTVLTAGTPFSGVYVDTIVDEWSYDGMICGRVTRPTSAAVVSIEGFLETTDKI